jgi:two-component system, OmpR family, phosphate regulon sensor histidine kinase PhoR
MIWILVPAVLLAGACGALILRISQLRYSHANELEKLHEDNSRLATHAANYQQKLRGLSESSGAGVVVLDNKGTVVHTNSTAERILDTQPHGLVGHALIQATLSAEMQEFVVHAAKTGRALSQDFQMPGSSSRILRASAYPLSVGLSGDPETMLVIVDVTELHRLETIRRDFVANVSHELRTPLASIRAIAETLHEGALHDQEVALPFLETIIREADRLGRISQDLLILSDAESKEPAKDSFDLTGLLREIVARSEKHALQSKLALTLRVEPGMRLFASRDQIEQVLVNLIENAIKYTAGEGTVGVEASQQEDKAVISVSDTGIGIRQQDLPRIFERFYRVDKARSRESGGTGLGLSIVKNIIESHGGEVKVSSEFNRGSTFTVTLPNPKDS